MSQYTYETKFNLTNPVNDFDAAQAYLSDDDMSEYLKRDIESRDHKLKIDPEWIESIDWVLTNEYSGKIILTTNHTLNPIQLKYISNWVLGQNSDGIGEGFEQQPFAEIYDEDEWGDPDPDSYDMASFDWQTNQYKFSLVKAIESKKLAMMKMIKESSDYTHLFKVGQKVRVTDDDFDSPHKMYKGTVTEVYSDHIIVDVPEISDHMWYDKDNIGSVYPEYNFMEMKEGKLKNSVLSVKFSIDPDLENSAYAYENTKKWLENLDTSDYTDYIKRVPHDDIKKVVIKMINDEYFSFDIYTTKDLNTVSKAYIQDLEMAAEEYVFSELVPYYQNQPYGIEVQKRKMSSHPNWTKTQNESKKVYDKTLMSEIVNTIRKKSIMEDTEPTEKAPQKIYTDRGGQYYVWKSGSDIYGSAEKPDPTKNIVNARSTINFTEQGFEDLQEVYDYILKYF